MADDANGVLYRIAYEGGSLGEKPMLPPARPMLEQAARGTGVPLAKDRPEIAGTMPIRVSSPAFTESRRIPAKHSEYADGVSPGLSWSAVPGARSYVLIMEDPDAKPITPFVQWVAWNIPPSVTPLPEGLQEQLRLTDPEGLLQGKTSRGPVGYYRPRPPVGESAHRYYVQVLALDRMLDIPVGSDRDAVLAAVKGHVIGKGHLMGRYQQSVAPLK